MKRGFSRSQSAGHPNRKKGELGIAQEILNSNNTNLDIMTPERLQALTHQTLILLPISKKELTAELGICVPYVDYVLNHMLAQDLITKTSQQKGKRGRPNILIQRKNNGQDIRLLVAASPCFGCMCSGIPETCIKLEEWLMR